MLPTGPSRELEETADGIGGPSPMGVGGGRGGEEGRKPRMHGCLGPAGPAHMSGRVFLSLSEVDRFQVDKVDMHARTHATVHGRVLLSSCHVSQSLQ